MAWARAPAEGVDAVNRLAASRKIAMLALIGVIGWLFLWVVHPHHASWDAMFYHRFAAEYAGASEAEQDAYGWESSEDHFDPEYREFLVANNSWPWRDWDDPMRERWVDQYRMRPLYPVMVAAVIPVLGTAAPVAVSLIATVVLTVGVGATLSVLIGWRTTLLVLVLLIANPYFARWLVFLQTDGIALSLFATAIGLVGLYVQRGERGVLVLLGVTVALLALARPLAVVVPAATGAALVVAVAVRHPVWRRLMAASVAAGVPVLAFVIGSTLLGFPTFNDLLQDLPTRHFSEPDVADPWDYIWDELYIQIASYLRRGVLVRPEFWLGVTALVAAGAGYVLARPGWWTVPMLFTVPAVVGTYVLHPSIDELNRTMAPAWLAVAIGLALFVKALAQRPRTPRGSAPPPTG